MGDIKKIIEESEKEENEKNEIRKLVDAIDEKPMIWLVSMF